jgi:methionyl aminopeptidase
VSTDDPTEIEGLRAAGRAVAATLRELRRHVRPGVTTAELDQVAARTMARHGARSAPRLLYGFPRHTCVSLNDEAVHGIPGPRPVARGDLVKLDVTAELDGYLADAAVTVAVPPAAPAARRLADCARAAFAAAAGEARAGRFPGDVGRALEAEVRQRGFAVIPELFGHGIGRAIHEPPDMPQQATPRGRRHLTEGLVVTIEPIVTAGAGRVVQAPDGWTIRTADGALVAHHEHTIVVTRGRPVVLTAA